MYPSGGNFRERHDASRQFALQRSLIVHLLLKIGQSERSLIKDLEADAAAGWQSFTSELYARLRDFE